MKTFLFGGKIFYLIIFLLGLHHSLFFAQGTVKIAKISGDKLAVDKGSSDGIYEKQVYDIVRISSVGQEIIGEAAVVLAKVDKAALKVTRLNTYKSVKSGDVLIRQGAGPQLQDSQSGNQSGMNTFGIRAGIGTDISGGIAYGAAINYLIPTQNHPFEVGLSLYGGSFEETTEELHTYVETTDIFVIAVLGNYLINYRPGRQGMFFVSGVGFGSISVEWEESSSTDISLGTPLPGGGSKQTADGSGAGMLLNLGIGYQMQNNFDVRFEVPVFVIFGAPEGASGFIPTFTLTAGLRFK